jgi:hypothetical protein
MYVRHSTYRQYRVTQQHASDRGRQICEGRVTGMTRPGIRLLTSSQQLLGRRIPARMIAIGEGLSVLMALRSATLGL